MLPQSSFDLEGLAAHRDRFPVPVLVSSPDTIHRSNDKAETYALLQRLGVKGPDFRRVNGAREVEAAARELGYPDRPVCFKPVFSSGSRGFRVLDPTVDRSHQLLHERPGAGRDAPRGGGRAPARRGRARPARDGARDRRRAHDRRDRGRQARRPRPPEDARGHARRSRDVLRHARGRGADGDGRQARRGARDRVVLQHPARRRARDRDQPADLDDRLPGGSEPPVPRREARARRDLGRGARRAPLARSSPGERACATSTRSTSTARSSTRARTRVAERPLRVTLCPVNTAGVPWTNTQALRRRGVDARLVVFERYKLHPEADESLEIPSNSRYYVGRRGSGRRSPGCFPAPTSSTSISG